jgi:hypothetical protein
MRGKFLTTIMLSMLISYFDHQNSEAVAKLTVDSLKHILIWLLRSSLGGFHVNFIFETSDMEFSITYRPLVLTIVVRNKITIPCRESFDVVSLKIMNHFQCHARSLH